MIDYKNKTRQELEDEANAITWDTHTFKSLAYAYPYSEFEHDSLTGYLGEVKYNEISPYQMVDGSKVYDTKLTWADMLTQVEAYKQDQLSKIDRAFRALALWNWGQAIFDTGVHSDSKNYDDFISKAIEGDEVEMASLEATDATNKSNNDYSEGVKERRRKMEVGQECIATVNYLNDVNAATDEQIAAQLSDADIQLVMQSLQTGSLSRAKSMITAKDLTGLEPMDQTYKDKVIALIDEYMGV